MPFAVFRRHQRKLLAVFAILAMMSFVVADSLPRLLSGGYTSGGNPVVTELFGKSIRRSDINEMAAERNNANLFMAQLTSMLSPRPIPAFFGDLNVKSMVDALILEHEADRLGIPNGPEAGREWIKRGAGAMMSRERFEMILAGFNNRITGEQLLSQIANQVRIEKVRLMLGAPVVTPLDVFQAYRDQNEHVSIRSVGFPVEDYLSKVPEPSPSEVQAFYDQFKNTLPDPSRSTPGFKVPREIQVEILTLDGKALFQKIKDQLTEAELRSYYENHKAELKIPSAFPDEIFQGAPELTPPLVQPYSEVRSNIAVSLAQEKGQAEIVSLFGRIKDDEMIPFADSYLAAADKIAEAKRLGAPIKETLPKPKSLKALAEKENLTHEITPLLSRDRAEHYGVISRAEVGLDRFDPFRGAHKFAQELFDSKSSLYEPIELSDEDDRRYLIRKLEDQAPRVPGLDEIRSEVVLAWKTSKARPLAKKAADDYADTVKAAGGKITAEIVEGHPVITTDAITRLRPGGFLPGQFMDFGPPTVSEIPQVPMAGSQFRDVYFALKPGDVGIAPNEPETVYYVMTLNRVLPATFDLLYAPGGDYMRYRSEAMTEAYRKRDKEWMNELRDRAGLPRDWVPKEETKKDDDDASDAA